MKCDRCNKDIEPGEEMDWYGRQLCEDCYMDMLSPTRPCDPWATMTAKSASQLGGDEEYLTADQQAILDVLQSGPISMENLARKTGLELPRVERELATLHHMEKVGAKIKDGRKMFQLWNCKDGENHDAF